jgi:hypothetical protein
MSEAPTMRRSVLIVALAWLQPIVAMRVCATEAVTADDEAATNQQTKTSSLKVTRGIVCKSIDGYEDYEPLPDAAQTSDEKLLVYVRVNNFKVEHKGGYYRGHLTASFEIRKRGAKAVLLQKQKMLDYEPKSRQPIGDIYLKNAISLKGLKTGDYDLSLIVEDELAKEPPATQVIKFKVIPVLSN